MRALDAQDLEDALRKYAGPFEQVPPDILALFGAAPEPLFPFTADSDKGLGILLLSAALYRPGGEAAAARVIAGLYRRFGTDIFRLNRVPFETLRDAVEALDAVPDAAERARIPGILRSVCDFFYRVGPLGPWLETAADWEMRVMELCGEIYWMGRHSEMKNKARYFLWLAVMGAARPDRFPQALSFAWPVGEGHLRFYLDFMNPPGKRTSSFDPANRLKTFKDLSLRIFPEAPWKLFAPLDSYLRRGGALQYRCRAVQGGCSACPLVKGCPGAVQA